MQKLKKLLRKKIPIWREKINELRRLKGQEELARVRVMDLLSGLRGLPLAICDTSVVDPVKGLFIRQVPCNDLLDASGEKLFYLLLTGEPPDTTAENELKETLEARSAIPQEVWQAMDALPEQMHSMSMLSTAVLMLQKSSLFQKALGQDGPRDKLWEFMLEDGLDLLAKLPVLAAAIFRQKLRHQPRIERRAGSGFSAGFARMLGLADEDRSFESFMERFVAVHCDHEGANASVFAARISHSAMTDIYLAQSSALNCLSGHLHGRANQESLRFILHIREKFNGIPTKPALQNHVRELLDQRRIIPGFGHAVLRAPDPRHEALADVGRRLFADKDTFIISQVLEQVVTDELKKRGKVKNPYANVDGISGVMLYNFGMRESEFYTVMFAVAQALGLYAQLIIERALMSPLVRPRSVTTQQLDSIK